MVRTGALRRDQRRSRPGQRPVPDPFFGLARPFSGEPSPWSWLGPANDLTSAIQAAALIPVALTLRDLIPGPLIRRWTTVGVSAMAAATILPLVLVAGLLPFAVQAPLVTLAIVIMFCWMFAVSRAGGRSGALARTTARVGMVTALALGATGLAAALAAAAPSGSAARMVAVGLAASAGIVAWLGFPAWTLLLQPTLRRSTADTRTARTRIAEPAVTSPEGDR